MTLWHAIIKARLVIGMLTAFVGFIVILPVIGYGTWHGYLYSIDAAASSRHTVGIRSIPRQS